METLKNLIGGELCDPIEGNYIDNYCPGTGQVYGRIPNSSKKDVGRAVQVAEAAFDQWSQMPPQQRAHAMMDLADLIEEHSEELARAESMDQGKPLWLSRKIEIPRGSGNLRYFAHSIMHWNSQAYTDVPGQVQYVHRQPIGPCALISPWNLPLYLLTWKIAPCIAAGNTAICKPSELTPKTASLLAELITQSKIPPGVINILHGEGPVTGEALITHPNISVVSFTGGTQTGQHIAKTVAPSFKKLSLELGGKNPNVIFADCDWDKMMATTLRSSFQNQGEICLCGSRIFVESKVFDQFIKEFVAKADQLTVGDPMDENSFMGALVSKGHRDKVLGYVRLAEAEGGQILTEQKVKGLSDSLLEGYYMRPTVITGLGPECRTNQEEIFGPVVTVTPFETENELMEMVNGVEYGLSASLWTSNVSRAHRLASNIKTGTVWVNDWMKRDLRVPFGGMKASGQGREGGESSLRFFTEEQTVSVSF